MDNIGVFTRNRVIKTLYKGIIKPVLFMIDPENVHDRMIRLGSILGSHNFGRALLKKLFSYKNDILHQNIQGLFFENPIGLAAGFDKNAELTDILPSVGFGFAEVGSITGDKCAGNPKPRLWRLPKSQSLVVYYGLKNDGCESIAQKLGYKHFTIPIGISVAMTNCKDNLSIESAIKDFAKAFQIMEPHASYLTVNISCPNTDGGQPFVIPDNLDKLFISLDQIPTDKLIFIKLSPDIREKNLDSILDIIHRHRIHGIICTNLTKDRNNPMIIDKNIPKVGGFSGRAVQKLSDHTLAHIFRREGRRYILIGCGGVFTAEDAYKKIRMGASLIQLITGMIYEGPQSISEINYGLVELLKRDGFRTVNDAIGADNC